MDVRQTVEEIAWRFRTGAPWRDIPERVDPGVLAGRRVSRSFLRGIAAVRRSASAGSDHLSSLHDRALPR